MADSIIVGVDGQSPSRRALEWACRRAASTGESVKAVWVLDDPRYLEEPLEQVEAIAREALRDQITQALAPLGEAAQAVSVTPVIVHGELVDGLEELSGGASLIVIGTNYISTIIGRVRGTRALRVAATSSIPVVVVPDVDLAGRAGVVVGTDGSEAADAATEFAAAEADRLGEPLTLVRSVRLRPGAVPAYVPAEDVLEEVSSDSRAALEELAAGIAERHPGLELRARLSSTFPSHELAQESETASLVVVGSRGFGAVRRFLLGSVSSEVLLNLRGPIAVVR